jgi:hypothetical protein
VLLADLIEANHEAAKDTVSPRRRNPLTPRLTRSDGVSPCQDLNLDGQQGIWRNDPRNARLLVREMRSDAQTPRPTNPPLDWFAEPGQVLEQVHPGLHAP